MKKLIIPLFLAMLSISACTNKSGISIFIPEGADKIEILAAREIRKYIYQRTDELPVIHSGLPEQVKGRAIIMFMDPMLEQQEFRLKTYHAGKDKVVRINGGSPRAMLYAAYEFAEQLGVRFYLHGDVIPDAKTQFSLPDVDIQKKPLFAVRGILPFHDFPEGPDWWNENDYKAVIAQLPKLKMNFIGFHTYPWRSDFNGEGPKSEPLVWIGTEDEMNGDGTVKAAYPVMHFTTGDSTWGYAPANTSEFLSGAARLFETDKFGADYMKDLTPWPHTEEENIGIFNESGRVFAAAFSFARELGVSVCVGTETPLIIPDPVATRHGLKSAGDREVKAFYRGIFSRIQKTYPVDYYWLWTPESWTWSGVEDKVVKQTGRDMQLAREALQEIGNPFTLATCGWVLGPPKDRTEFDRMLPKDIPFSCINRGLGYTPVDKGFHTLEGRSKWSIPWMEDDPALLTAQLWAGRMRRDALDSWKYGCDGLFGIHWRTRNIGPTVSALAKAAWECDRYDQTVTSRDLPVEDFYTDWTATEFGNSNPVLVRIFTELDGRGVELREGQKGDAPLNASDWIQGPGALMVNRDPEDIQDRLDRYEFIPELEAFRKQINGAGNMERFDYWLNTFLFNEAVLEVTQSQIELNLIVERMKKESNAGKKSELAGTEAIPKRIELARRWERMNRILMRMVSTTGELGTIANLEMHNIRKNGNLTGHDAYLRSVLNEDLPAETAVSEKYTGPARMVVTGNPSILHKGEDLYLRIRVLSEEDNISGKIHFRKLGGKEFATTLLNRISSNVFEVRIPARSIPDDLEYYLEVEANHEKVLYPATATHINCAVIVL